MTNEVSSRSLRVALLTNNLGSSNLIYSKSKSSPITPTQLNSFVSFASFRLQHAPDNGGFLRCALFEMNEEWIRIDSIADIETSDFGQEEVSEKRMGHSFVQVKTGFVYLVGENESVPEVKFGVRCSVIDETSWGNAFSESTGRLKSFSGGARELIELGVEVDGVNDWGETGLMLVAGGANRDAGKVMEWLLEMGANPNHVGSGGEGKCTAMHLCVQGGVDEECAGRVKILLKWGGMVNVRNGWGITPLHIAANRGLKQTCKVLLDAGADQSLKDFGGRTAKDFASEKWIARNVDGEPVIRDFASLFK